MYEYTITIWIIYLIYLLLGGEEEKSILNWVGHIYMFR